MQRAFKMKQQRLNDIEYLGVICVAVLLDKSISQFLHYQYHGFRVPFTGVIEMSALVDKEYLGGNALVYLPKYVVANDPLLDQSDEEIKNYFIDNFKKMYPWLTDDNIKFVGVARAKHVILLQDLAIPNFAGRKNIYPRCIYNKYITY